MNNKIEIVTEVQLQDFCSVKEVEFALSALCTFGAVHIEDTDAEAISFLNNTLKDISNHFNITYKVDSHNRIHILKNGVSIAKKKLGSDIVVDKLKLFSSFLRMIVSTIDMSRYMYNHIKTHFPNELKAIETVIDIRLHVDANNIVCFYHLIKDEIFYSLDTLKFYKAIDEIKRVSGLLNLLDS